MRAFVVEHLQVPPHVKDIPAPQPGAHEVLVRVTIAAVNPIDWKIIADPSRSGKALPFVAGQDFAGVIEGLGTNAKRFAIGERIFGVAHQHGAYAEYTVIPEDESPGSQPVSKIPDGVGDADAAALPTAGLTALASLEQLHVGSNSIVAILGATGGVGGFATQLAKLRGAHVIATAHSGSEDVARAAGADYVIPYDREDTLAAIRDTYPNGIDAVLDLVNGANASKGLAPAIRSGGRIVSTIGSIDVAWFKQNHIDGNNIAVGRSPQSSHEGLRYLVKLVESGDLKVRIAGERSLSDAAQALELSRSGSVHGKVLITITKFPSRP